jgi:hypothetical protein
MVKAPLIFLAILFIGTRASGQRRRLGQVRHLTRTVPGAQPLVAPDPLRPLPTAPTAPPSRSSQRVRRRPLGARHVPVRRSGARPAGTAGDPRYADADAAFPVGGGHTTARHVPSRLGPIGPTDAAAPRVLGPTRRWRGRWRIPGLEGVAHVLPALRSRGQCGSESVAISVRLRERRVDRNALAGRALLRKLRVCH